MNSREASCSCGRRRLRCSGEPVRISICHCLERQKRTGSAFGAQARFPSDKVEFVSSEHARRARTGDEGSTATFRFCPTCGSTVGHTNDNDPGRIAVTLDAFTEPSFPPPRFSVYEGRKRAWVAFNGREPVEHDW
jgi:hypothetical protein